MTYNSKKTLVSMITSAVIYIVYIVYAFGDNAPDNLKSWGIAMLIFIGASVVGLIVIQILFHIGFAIETAVKNQDCEEKEVERIISAEAFEDERDKLISLKSSQISHICAGIGFLIFLIILAVDGPIIFALNALLVAFFAGSLIEGAVSIYHYERGVQDA